MADQNVTPNPDGNTPSGEGTPNPNPNPNPASPAVKPGEGTPAEKVFTFKEDRSDWKHPDHFNRVNSKLTKLEQENLSYKEKLELAEKRTRALAGVEPVDEETQRSEEIKGALLKVFPNLKMLENLSEEQLERVLEAAESAQSTSHAQWSRHAETMFASVEDAIADELGLDKLTESQVKRIRREYREAAAEAVAQRPRDERGRVLPDPTGKDFLTRHERGDKTLVTEFVKQFLADWYEPARRSVTRGVVNRQSRPVPRGERTRNTPVSGPPAIDYNNEDAFRKALLEARNSGA